jgi:YeeE/YedE family (DUF395).
MNHFPLDIGGPISGLILGVIFGVALEGAGFGSACKLTAQLRFSDWGVFKVMMTAIIVTAFGTWVLGLAGVMPQASIFVPQMTFIAALLGGVGVGAGMAIGGYCPGTSVVAFASGRLDGLMFFVGLIFGAIVFAGAYTWLFPVTAINSRAAGVMPATISALLHIPDWVVILALLAAVIIVGRLTRGPSKISTSPSEMPHDAATQRS